MPHFFCSWTAGLRAGGEMAIRAAITKKDLENEAQEMDDKFKPCPGSTLEKTFLFDLAAKQISNPR